MACDRGGEICRNMQSCKFIPCCLKSTSSCFISGTLSEVCVRVMHKTQTLGASSRLETSRLAQWHKTLECRDQDKKKTEKRCVIELGASGASNFGEQQC